jgi:hypothetical protein
MDDHSSDGAIIGGYCHMVVFLKDCGLEKQTLLSDKDDDEDE